MRAQDGKGKDAIVHAKFFHCLSNWTWYATEYDPEERVFFGIVDGHSAEWGYFSLDEMESLVVHGLKMERDLYWEPTRVGDITFNAERVEVAQ
jgi:hypothetical protein